MKAIGNWLLKFLGRCAQLLMRVVLFLIGTACQLLGKTLDKLGQEIQTLGK